MEKIRFKDLDVWLKMAVIVSWVLGIIWVASTLAVIIMDTLVGMG